VNENPDNDSFAILCVRYLSGEANSTERTALVEALQDEDLKRRFESMQEAWNCVPHSPKDDFDTTSAFNALNLDEGAQQTDRRHATAQFFSKRRLRMIGGLVVMLVGSFALFRYAPTLFSNPSDGQLRWIEKRNNKGQCSAISLADGTRITLNADSSLMIPEAGNGDDRIVRLDGEALFDVTHDDRRPFTVELDALRLTVLGTKFDVCAYPGDGYKQVSLLSGRLLVTRTGPDGEPEQTILAPGEAYRLDSVTGKAEVIPFEMDSAVAWTHERIVFKDERMDQVARKLERRFDIPIVIKEPSIGDMEITGAFDRESLDNILQVICLATNLHCDIVRKGNQIDRIVVEEQ